MIGVVTTIVMALDRPNEILYPLGSKPRHPYNFYRGFPGVGIQDDTSSLHDLKLQSQVALDFQFQSSISAIW
jgi:hypothetical protein